MTESLNPLDPNYRAFAKIFEAFKVWSSVVSLFVITVKVLFILELESCAQDMYRTSWHAATRTARTNFKETGVMVSCVQDRQQLYMMMFCSHSGVLRPRHTVQLFLQCCVKQDFLHVTVHDAICCMQHHKSRARFYFCNCCT